MKPHIVSVHRVAGLAARPNVVSLSDGPHRPIRPYYLSPVARALALALLTVLVLVVGLRPAQAAVGIVVNVDGDIVADNGFCTLREAITAANTDTASGTTAGECAAGAGADVITFAHSYTINMYNDQLPVVTTAMTINGDGPAKTVIQASFCNPVTLPNGCTPADHRVFEVAGGNLTLDQVTVRHGRCTGTCYGGGINLEQGTLTITNSFISGNEAYMGGGINVYAGTLAVTNSMITGNSAYNGGGVNNNEYSVATITNCTFADNAASYGGGIINWNTLRVFNSTFSGNSAEIGGGMFNSMGTATVTNSTISGNSAANGGGMSNWGTLLVTNSTFAGNSATTTGGGIDHYDGTTILANSLLGVGSIGPNCSYSNAGLSIDATNIADDASCGAATQMTAAAINLGPLADNGGPTMTHAQLPGSAAIDFNRSASCTGYPVDGLDQRGQARNVDGDGVAGDYECDAGAYEAQLGRLTIAKTTDPAGGTDFPFTLDLGTYAYERKWQADHGYFEGEFQYPSSVAVDAAGNIYVTDTFNARVQKFDNAGNFLLTWGWGVADNTNTFQICSSDCTQGHQGSGEGQFMYPQGIAIDAAGDVWVAEMENGRIQHYSSGGAYLGQWPTGGKPFDLVFDAAGDLFVSDIDGHRVQKFTPAGVLLDQWGSPGTAEAQFDLVTGLDIDTAGNIYVNDFRNYRIQKFTADGDFLLMWGWGVEDGSPALQTCTAGCQAGRDGNGNGQLYYASDILSTGRTVLVADRDNNRIQAFDPDGAYLYQLGQYGSGDGEFLQPSGLAFDAAGNLYVVDSSNDRVQVFTPDRLSFTLDDGDSETFTLPSGPYRVSEALPNDWVLDHVICDGGNPGNDNSGIVITLGAATAVNCTFSNTQLPGSAALTVIKEVSGGPDTWSFAFSGDLGPFTLTNRHRYVAFRDLLPDTYTFSETADPNYVTAIACDNGDSSATGDVSVSLVEGDDVTCIVTNTYAPPARLFMSATTAGTTGDGLPFGSEDIIQWNGSEWSMAFDGSAAGLTARRAVHNINAFSLPQVDDEVLIVFTQNRRTVPDITFPVDGMDIVHWNGSDFLFHFDGSDVGLTNLTQEKIDGLHVLDGADAPPALSAAAGGTCQSYLLISTAGPGKVPNFSGGTLSFGGEDVLGFCATQLGTATAGKWIMVLDGSAQGMPKNSTDSISVSADGETL